MECVDIVSWEDGVRNGEVHENWQLLKDYIKDILANYPNAKGSYEA